MPDTIIFNDNPHPERTGGMPRNAYPDNNPKTVLGLSKPSFHAIPASALIELGRGMANGEKKYGLYNYRDKTVTASIYYDAALRHILSWWDGEELAEDSEISHLGHAMACLAIVIDAKSVGKLNDDRGTHGAFGAMLKEYTNAS